MYTLRPLHVYPAVSLETEAGNSKLDHSYDKFASAEQYLEKQRHGGQSGLTQAERYCEWNNVAWKTNGQENIHIWGESSDPALDNRNR